VTGDVSQYAILTVGESLGDVTEAFRSDTAAAVVRLHPERLLFIESTNMISLQHSKRHGLDSQSGLWCNGSTPDF